MMMKRLFAAFLIVMMAMLTILPAFADDDISDIDISGAKWTEGKPSMLNVGYADVALGETLADANAKNKCKTIKNKINHNQVEGLLDDGFTFYTYVKFGARNVQYLKIKANLIITAPNGKYYRVDKEKTYTDRPGTHSYYFFFKCTKAFEDIRSDNGGSLPTGSYDFTVLFNGDTFRTTTIKIN